MSDDDIRIDFEETETRGRYSARVDGIAEAGELTISKVTPSLVIADHTMVPDSLRGRGVAAALAERLIADARARGQRVVPLCPFVRSQALRHPEWSDVIQN
ncbi:N-acetyltransferase [Pseudooceanicola sp. CBS1P-1]|uniref:N-acetyltransferase n=1 Tax=Pseudooceanicola albus TaxID=2692189 RepID=A0A6L7G4D4_9RHOB|nr:MULTISPECIES: GNAT family N-acetyltransferase [Pseudooceanicola]MBT9385422.1 N-acetyltransferase [Pseudooceanicola endophyticus]MXN18719.1 N-acetyltransferase [Pseudooceanicola albus]